MKEEKLGTVRIAPDVLSTIVRLTALDVEGVSRLSPGGVGKFLSREAPGVKVQVEDEQVSVDLYIVAKRDASLLQVGTLVQQQVAEAIQNMVGMDARVVNVYIQDVD
ncbi:MAG: Asp23/Gls24 family envelope stress response protein [Chloroflexi bacterium]|nr:Asp23/Gls24 family envelope stress response protein [Chloroflexota bacterium]MBU1746550.1 Asp23/Gls24 family envelope stress response protein [Chloroflexota bacterium]MBU1878354.1 Asp23/Gls24 family envelope stress response protein [Chloroflexota bacterium]